MSRRGKAQTVLGLIDPESLGVTLMHDHIFVDLTALVLKPGSLREMQLAKQPVSLANLGWIRFHAYENYDNMVLDDEGIMGEEVIHFKALGGNTIVDPAPPEIGRDPSGLRRISRITGINMVCGTSHYLHVVHKKDMQNRSAKEVADEFIQEIEQGIGETGVRAGIIGEIGNSSPWHEDERKCCIAAARAQQQTGASITIHPGRSKDSPLLILNLLKKEGANLERVVMGHIENRIFELKALEGLADLGCCLEFDAFGTEHFPFGENPSDEDRVRLLARMIDDGYGDRIVISHDICRKYQLRRYGGFGYGHVLENILPLFRKIGVSNKELQRILVENPRRLLTFTS